MKKVILVLLFTLYANAGMWTRLTGATTETRQPDAFYALDTAGENVRVYEFTPKTQPDVKCIIVFTEGDKSPVMQCTKKGK